MRNLLDILHHTDAIEIDGTFCRHFHLELEECEKDEDIVLSVEFECDGNIHEHYFTKKELEEAVHITGTHGFVVNNSVTGTNVIPYSVTEIIA